MITKIPAIKDIYFRFNQWFAKPATMFPGISIARKQFYGKSFHQN